MSIEQNVSLQKEENVLILDKDKPSREKFDYLRPLLCMYAIKMAVLMIRASIRPYFDS